MSYILEENNRDREREMEKEGEADRNTEVRNNRAERGKWVKEKQRC